MKKTVLKAIVFLGLLLMITYSLKLLAPAKNSLAALIFKEMNNTESNTSFYFIGSSRVKKSLDPNILRNHFETSDVHNLGISGSTLLSNALIAEYIIRQDGYKVLFFELSRLRNILPQGTLNFSAMADIHPLKSTLFLIDDYDFEEKVSIGLDVWSRSIINSVSLKAEVRRIFGLTEEIWLGFNPKDIKGYTKGSFFLSSEEMFNGIGDSVELTKYNQIISRLVNLASQHNSKIVFFLPITYKNVSEKEIVIPLFHSLSDSERLIYSRDFLQTMSDTKLLMDMNHFNEKGAQLYTNGLIPLIEPYFNNVTSD